PNNWNRPSLWPVLNPYGSWTGGTNFSAEGSSDHQEPLPRKPQEWETGDELIGFESGISRHIVYMAAGVKVSAESKEDRMMDMSAPPPEAEAQQAKKGEEVFFGSKAPGESGPVDSATVEEKEAAAPPAIRSNFDETAFFFPQLNADSS